MRRLRRRPPLSASAASSLESSVACQARNLCAQIGNYCDCVWERGPWNRDYEGLRDWGTVCVELELELELTYLGASARFWLKSKNSQQIAPAVVRMYLTDTFLYTAQLYYVCNKCVILYILNQHQPNETRRDEPLSVETLRI